MFPKLCAKVLWNIAGNSQGTGIFKNFKGHTATFFRHPMSKVIQGFNIRSCYIPFNGIVTLQK